MIQKWKTCSRGHKYQESGPCPVCWPGNKKIKRLDKEFGSHTIVLKRIYNGWSKEDGFRILVDRLWPRGISKEKAHVDLWLKDIAPGDSLRRWFNHDTSKWQEFKKRYREELKDKQDLITAIRDKLPLGTVTFVYAAKDERYNNAVALKEYIK